DGHGYNQSRRLAAYDWFGRWLKGARDTDPEPQIEMATPEELRCTATGQVSTSLGGESVFTLNRSEEHTSELQSRRDLVCRLLLLPLHTSTLFPTRRSSDL